MASIGDLVCNLKLDSTEFKRGAEESSRAMEGLKDTFRETATALGVGFGIEKFVEGVKGGIEGVVEMAHGAEKLGMGVTALSALKHEATMTHVEFETLEHGIGKMEKTIADAARGGKEGAESMSLLRLNVADVVNLSADEQFGKIADSIAAMENPTDRALAAMKTFGKGGIELMNILRLGSDGMKQASEEAKRLGVSVSELEAAKVLEIDAGMKQLGESIQGVWRNVAEELGPSIIKACEGLERLIAGKDKLGNKTPQKKDFDAIPDEDKSKTLGIGITPGGLIDIVRRIGDYRMEARELEKFNKPILEPSKGEMRHHGDKPAAGKETKESLALAAMEAENLQKEFDDATKAGEQMSESMKTPIQKAMDKFEEAKDLFDGGFIDSETYATAWDKVGDAIQKVQDEKMKPFEDEQKRMRDQASQFVEESMSPLDKYKEKIGQITDLLLAGALSNEEAVAASAKAKEDLDKATNKKGNEPQRRDQKLEAFSTHSREWQEQLVQSMRAGGQKEQQDLLARQVEYLKMLVTNTDPGRDPDTDPVVSITGMHTQ